MHDHVNKHEIMPGPRQNIKVFLTKYYKQVSSVTNNTRFI